MANTDRAFVAISLSWRIAGLLLGSDTGPTGDLKLLDGHAAMLLPGFDGLTL
jgi:hypothetical protein